MTTEAQRQQALMAALLRGEGAALQPWLAERPADAVRGLQAYQANAGASAERALAAAFPTVQALVGEDSFASLARAVWHAHPPSCGDLAQFGEELPAFIAASEQLADVPYLSSCAQLDWALAVAERAADAEVHVPSLALLSDPDPAQLRLTLRPGTALVDSTFPIVTLWQAHQPGGEVAAARAALAAGQGEHAVVWREGWRARVAAVDTATARWTQSLLRGEVLSVALESAGAGFNFETWLVQALQQQWLWRAERT